MIKKSVVIANRHQTSISLEEEFLAELQEITQAQHISLNELITRIDSERKQHNLSSAIRVYILQYLKSKNAQQPPAPH